MKNLKNETIKNIFNLYLRELLPLHSNVTLIGSALDQYNRTLSQVVNSKGININKKMMELGLVALYPGQKGNSQDLIAEFNI